MNIEIQQWLNADADWRKSPNGYRAGVVLYSKWGTLNSWKGVFAKQHQPSNDVKNKLEDLLDELYEESKKIPERAAAPKPPKVVLKKKNPNHYWNGTMNVYLPNGEQQKVHKRLIEAINGKPVRFGKAGIGSISYADMLKMLYTGEVVELTWCKFSAKYKTGGERVTFKIHHPIKNVPVSVVYNFTPPPHLESDFELLKTQGNQWFQKMCELQILLQSKNKKEERYVLAKEMKLCEENYLWIDNLKRDAIDLGAIPESFLRNN